MKKLLVLAGALVTAAGISVAIATASPSPGGDLHLTNADSTRSGALHVTKECSAYTGQAWSYCTITGSNLGVIETGSTVVYASAAGSTSLDSDLVVYVGHGTVAVGHVTLDFATASGLITISGGTGRLSGFHARAAVSFDPSTGLWHWDGTYRFSRDGDDNAAG
jgi:hypothetical protein